MAKTAAQILKETRARLEKEKGRPLDLGVTPKAEGAKEETRDPVTLARRRILRGEGTEEDFATLRQAKRLGITEESMQQEEERRAEALEQMQERGRSPAELLGQKAGRIVRLRSSREQALKQEIGAIERVSETLDPDEMEAEARKAPSVQAFTDAIMAQQDTIAMARVAQEEGAPDADVFIQRWDLYKDALFTYDQALEAGGDPLEEREKFRDLYLKYPEEILMTINYLEERKAAHGR